VNRFVRIAKSVALATVCAIVVGAVSPTASAITVYDRNAAVAYANEYWNKVVSDGSFWINGSTSTYYGAGQPVPVNVLNEASGIGDDCAHYVSSVIGSEPHEKGGGLTIPNRAGTYGEPGAARLDELLVGNSAGGYGTLYQYGQLVSSVSQLTPGDVIGYDWDGSGGGSMSGIDHTVVYVGNNQVDCHATSHLGANWSLGGAADYFFIHITLPDVNMPTTPANSAPTASSYVTSLTPTLSGSAFADTVLGGSQKAAEWQVYNNRGFLTYDSGTDTSHLTSLTVPAGKLVVGFPYTWQVRYQDNYGDWSSYSTPTSFTTMLGGDFNYDGSVNAADYLVWRKGMGTTYTQSDYNTWRQNFGTSTAGGTDLGGAEVPEPAGLMLMALALLSAVAVRTHRPTH
jgi:Putative amidase domain